MCGVCCGELWLPRKKNCLLSSIFPAGEGGFGQMMYPSPEWSPQDSRDGIFLHSAQASFSWPRVDQARLLRGEHILGLFGLYPSSLSKSVGFVSLSGKASLVSISAAILFLRSWHVYFPLEFEFRGKSCVEWEHVGENGISCLLRCILLLYIKRILHGKCWRSVFTQDLLTYHKSNEWAQRRSKISNTKTTSA